MLLTIGSDLKHQVGKGSIGPLVFEPEIDWARFVEPNIIHAY
jgi:hypothetical protein